MPQPVEFENIPAAHSAGHAPEGPSIDIDAKARVVILMEATNRRAPNAAPCHPQSFALEIACRIGEFVA
jgi:hypothetical protein